MSKLLGYVLLSGPKQPHDVLFKSLEQAKELLPAYDAEDGPGYYIGIGSVYAG